MAAVKAEGSRHIRRSAALVVCAFLTLGLGGCLGYDGDIQHGYVVDPDAFQQVKVGSSAEQVLVVLGTPTTTSTVGGNAWYYINQRTESPVLFMTPKVVDQHVIGIYFDQTKKVTRVANWGLEDGRVIDFITRETPTGGQEESFLNNALKGLLKF
jgi:outer membrane protein assembly factor BamE (lipoprotein component of BamABCDE complex)